MGSNSFINFMAYERNSRSLLFEKKKQAEFICLRISFNNAIKVFYCFFVHAGSKNPFFKDKHVTMQFNEFFRDGKILRLWHLYTNFQNIIPRLFGNLAFQSRARFGLHGLFVH